MTVLSGTPLAAWLLVLGWLPMLVGVRRAGFAPRMPRAGRGPALGPRDEPPVGADRRTPEPERTPEPGGLGPSGARRDGAPARSTRDRGLAVPRWALLDVTLLLLTWLAGAALTYFAFQSVRRLPPPGHPWAGLALFLSGVAAWAWTRLVHGTDYAQLPRAPRALVTRGPYRVLRHPLYLSTACAGLGQFVAGATVRCLACWILLVAILIVRSLREERILHAVLGAAWETYARQVPALFPPRRRR